MEYDPGDSSPFDFEANGFVFGSRWIGKLFERKLRSIFSEFMVTQRNIVPNMLYSNYSLIPS